SLLSLLLLPGPPALAQPPAPSPSPSVAPPPPPLVSPEVQPDRGVTFRFRAPNAKEVILDRANAARVPMQKDESGVWTITTEPLPADFYGYAFEGGGRRVLAAST